MPTVAWLLAGSSKAAWLWATCLLAAAAAAAAAADAAVSREEG